MTHKCPICRIVFECGYIENFIKHNGIKRNDIVIKKDNVVAWAKYRIRRANYKKLKRDLDECTEKQSPLCARCFDIVNNKRMVPVRDVEGFFIRWESRLERDRKVKTEELQYD